jgi:lysophospholipase L1-like esterase
MAVKSGYGPGFCALVVEPSVCINMAKGGRSSGSYRAEGSWAQVMEQLKTNSAFKDTYVLIQFGHNDQPGKPGRSTDLATEFPVNLAHYVEDVKASGAKAILVTALTRRSFKDGQLKDSLGPWAAATRKVAGEENVPLLDLNAESAAAVQKMGPVEANSLAMAPPPPEAVESATGGNSVSLSKAPAATEPKGPAPPVFDYTHLGAKGAAYFGRMVADELTQAIPDLKPYFKP